MDSLTKTLIRMALMVRRRPSRQRVYIIVIVLIFAFMIVAVERAGLWPDWMRAEPVKNRGVSR
ncbi:hypothetical protein ASF70_08160 [Rhizobium sp. Leaf321]|nr:hypothetical protein ASF70_08160 [Rhizobium sp. Leaf321]